MEVNAVLAIVSKTRLSHNQARGSHHASLSPFWLSCPPFTRKPLAMLCERRLKRLLSINFHDPCCYRPPEGTQFCQLFASLPHAVNEAPRVDRAKGLELQERTSTI
jgi:hypothetical protein